jgi:hypothetical protein
MDGSDGTRTRDLRRDRPAVGSASGARWKQDRLVVLEPPVKSMFSLTRISNREVPTRQRLVRDDTQREDERGGDISDLSTEVVERIGDLGRAGVAPTRANPHKFVIQDDPEQARRVRAL